MSGRLVSVITGTWQRPSLLIEAVQNVREQTYRPLEHVIVSDGPDPVLRAAIDDLKSGITSYPAAGAIRFGPQPDIPITFVELGRNWSTYLTNSLSCIPFMVANYLARGEYQMWLSDDERMKPQHIESLVTALESAGADFAYSLAECYHADQPGNRWIVGTDPPEPGTIMNALHKTELLDIGGFRPHVGSGSDWDQVQRWMDGGANWVCTGKPTFLHRGDKRPWLEE